MTDTKFTPGPWVTVKVGHDKTLIRQALDCSGVEAGYIGEVYYSRPGRYKPNTALIAAAPDLYAELYDLLPILEHNILKHQPDSIDNNHYYSIENRLKRIKDALSKARGENK